MTQPPARPPQEGFGAPYDPPPGTPPPAPGYGYPPQQPGPYAQPGPYSQAGPYAQHPGYGYPAQPGHGYPAQPPAVGAAPGGPAGTGRGGRPRGRTGAVVGAVLALALLVGGGVWLATGDDGGGKKPVAGPSGSASPTGDKESGKGDGKNVAGPTAAELNAGRKPGEAKVAWLAENGVDLPQYGEETHGPWFAGDVVAKGMYRKVTGYAVADGAERWSLRLPTDLCASP
ncbi:hypothetical protein ABT169_17355 [Streptomyces sp. NPDC001616]